jgi:hypothetical protein
LVVAPPSAVVINFFSGGGKMDDLTGAVLHLADGRTFSVRPLVGPAPDERLLYFPGFITVGELEGAHVVLGENTPPVGIEVLDLRGETTNSIIRVRLLGRV